MVGGEQKTGLTNKGCAAMDDRSMHCALFPVNRGFDYVVQCSHVVMVPFSASLWYSDRMKDVV